MPSVMNFLPTKTTDYSDSDLQLIKAIAYPLRYCREKRKFILTD